MTVKVIFMAVTLALIGMAAFNGQWGLAAIAMAIGSHQWNV